MNKIKTGLTLVIPVKIKLNAFTPLAAPPASRKHSLKNPYPWL